MNFQPTIASSAEIGVPQPKLDDPPASSQPLKFLGYVVIPVVLLFLLCAIVRKKTG